VTNLSSTVTETYDSHPTNPERTAVPIRCNWEVRLTWEVSCARSRARLQHRHGDRLFRVVCYVACLGDKRDGNPVDVEPAGMLKRGWFPAIG